MISHSFPFVKGYLEIFLNNLILASVSKCPKLTFNVIHSKQSITAPEDITRKKTLFDQFLKNAQKIKTNRRLCAIMIS